MGVNVLTPAEERGQVAGRFFQGGSAVSRRVHKNQRVIRRRIDGVRERYRGFTGLEGNSENGGVGPHLFHCGDAVVIGGKQVNRPASRQTA